MKSGQRARLIENLSDLDFSLSNGSRPIPRHSIIVRKILHVIKLRSHAGKLHTESLQRLLEVEVVDFRTSHRRKCRSCFVENIVWVAFGVFPKTLPQLGISHSVGKGRRCRRGQTHGLNCHASQASLPDPLFSHVHHPWGKECGDDSDDRKDCLDPASQSRVSLNPAEPDRVCANFHPTLLAARAAIPPVIQGFAA